MAFFVIHKGKGRISPKTAFYLCCANEEFKRISDEEIGMCEWLSYSRAFDLLKYKKQKEILSKANKFIKEECNESCIKR